MLKQMIEGVTLEKQGDTWLVNADSVSTLAALAENPDSMNRSKWTELNSRDKSPWGSNEKWYGVSSAAENQRIINSGMWVEGVRRMEDALDQLSAPTPISVRRSTRWTDQGDELDIHRVNNGQLLTAWRRSGPRRRTGSRQVTIMANIGINASTHSDELFWKGAAAMKLADILTAAGYSVEIIAAFTSKGVNRNYTENACLTTVVKPMSSPLDVNELAVSICLAGFFRHVMFKALLAIPNYINSGLGQAVKYRTVVSEEMDNRQMILCESMSDAKQANAWIAEQVAALESGDLEVVTA